jgi:putative membrane protein
MAVAAGLAAVSTLAPSAQADQNPVKSVDRAFVAGASESNAAEIAAAKVALRKGDASSKRFAQQMIRDHTRLGKSLSSVASRMQLQTRNQPSVKQRADLAKLAGLSGAAFDRAYLTQQVRAHASTILIFQKELRSGGAPMLKKAAAAALPTIRMHLGMARKLVAGTASG